MLPGGDRATSWTGRVQAGHLLPTVLLAAAGCIPAVNNRVEAPEIAPARVVVMPPVAIVYSLDAFDKEEIQRQPSRAITSDLEYSLGVIAKENGATMADPSSLKACGVPCVRFVNWGTIASLEIGVQRSGVRNFGLHSVADWWFKGDLPSIRRVFDVDYALITLFKQARETTGRQVVSALAGGYTYGKQIDVVCIADLRDGHMSWCAAKREDGSDLGEENRASATLVELTQPLFRVPPEARNVPKRRGADGE
jgi:hypothetical protein